MKVAVKWVAIHTHRAPCPSGVDIYAWWQICTSFGDASASLYDALASVARCLSTTSVDSAVLMPFIACQLIPLDKHPGVAQLELGMFLFRLLLRPFFSLLVMMLYLLLVLYKPYMFLQIWSHILKGSLTTDGIEGIGKI